MLAFRARYVFPIDGPPLRDGVVAIDHDRIVAVGESSSPAIRDLLPAARDLGEAAILPGFINPHTHLEFSDLRQPLGTPGMALPDWIRLVVNHRRSTLADDRQEYSLLRRIESGLAESTQSGVTALGEIASSPWGQRSSMSETEITQFVEFIGLRDGTRRIGEMIALSVRRTSSETFRLGISPHAPYSVHPDLVRACVAFSISQKTPLAHHLAESREELQLLRTREGPFIRLLQDLDAWDADAIPFGSRPMDYLRMLAEAHRALVIHGNYLDDEEIGFLAQQADRMSVVYCPRTHAYFKHDPYPLAKMLAAGVNVAIGTDSRASNPDLSVLADMRFAARQHPVVLPAVLLRMITVAAARALGRDDEIGTITPGKFADLAILSLPRHSAAEPHELLFDSDCHVKTTIFRGRAVFGKEWLQPPASAEG